MTISDSNNLVFVAEVDRGDQSIIGFCSGGANRSAKTDPDFAGELGAIYILEEYRGKGTGKALVQSLVRTLLDRGYRSMLVWVLAENLYRPFYEKLGGQYIRSKEIEIGGRVFEEVAYGWRDIEILLARLV
jgi:GNAT superfamily N-acetyltransferase